MKELLKELKALRCIVPIEYNKSTRLVDCDVSVRALNAAKQNDIDTLADLSCFSEKQIKKFRNIGDRSIEEYKELLEKANLTFDT